MAAAQGVTITPVWNKSNREHMIVDGAGQRPCRATPPLRRWAGGPPTEVDADHINLTTVDRFIAPSDFFTLDVADAIGKPAEQAAIDALFERHADLGVPLA